MTPTKQNRAIARLLGWKDTPPYKKEPMSLWPDKMIHDMLSEFMIKPDGRNADRPRNYCGDLNLIHAAMNQLMDSLGDGPWFYEELEKIVGRDRGIDLRNPSKLGYSGWIAHATAAQLSEALLKRYGVWEEND